MKNILLAIAFVAALQVNAAVSAENLPTRPITMIATFAAGGTNDVIARIMSARMSELLNQQVIVENVAGAGGMTGAFRVAKAAPDGYQFVIAALAYMRTTRPSTKIHSTTPQQTLPRLASLPKRQQC